MVPDTGYREPRRDGWTGRRDASGSRPPRGADRREASAGQWLRVPVGAWNRLGTVAELDAVTGDVPVVLTSGDAHNGWLNSAALGLLGVTGVTGPLEENDWFRLQPAISALLEEIEEGGAAEAALRSAMADAAARGSRGRRPRDAEQLPAVAEPVCRRARPAPGAASVYPDALDDLLTAGVRTGDPLSAGR